ncbi:MAG: VOC family protein [Thaumarchaeota archaeon]|nr:VOC family protein [Nitrososphaerota archaeon]
MSLAIIMNNTKLLHTCINVTDLERSLKFYDEILGFKLERRQEVPENNAEMAFINDGIGGSIELTHWRDKTDYVEGDQLDHIAVGVPNVDDAVKEFRTKGVKIAKEPFSLAGGSLKLAFIKDPDGVWIELISK